MSSEDGNSHTQPEIGRVLERARTGRGLSLWEVEETTKIRARYLRDLERENFDVLPAVYVVGSLKTYADFLGLDGEALALELKNRQSPAQEESPTREEAPPQAERVGFLASLVALLGGSRAEDEGDAAAPGRGPRLYWGLGGVLILALLVSLVSTLEGGARPAVPEIREPAISEAPARLAFSSEVESREDGERDAKGKTGARPDGDDEPSNKGDKEDGQRDEADRTQKEREDQDAGAGQETDDVEIALPESPTYPAGTASAGASVAASASASSSAATSAGATATASATASAASPVAAAPRTANPGAAPRPATAEPTADGQPAPATGGATAGPPRTEAAGVSRPTPKVVGKVRVIKSVVRYVR